MKRGLTQAEMANSVGVSRSAVSQWERYSGTKPNPDNLAIVADLLKVHYEWLATGRGPMGLDDSHQEPPAHMAEFAFDAQESRLLAGFRMLTARKKDAVVDLVERIKS